MPSSSSPLQRASADQSTAASATPSVTTPVVSCTQVRARLDELVDGELSADVETTVRQHVESCAACRQLEHSVRQLLAAIVRSNPHIVAPRRLRVRVAQMMSETDPTPDV